MLWLRTTVPAFGHIVNCIKGLNVIVSFLRFNRQMGLDYLDIFGNLRTGTTRERDWCLELQIHRGQTQD